MTGPQCLTKTDRHKATREAQLDATAKALRQRDELSRDSLQKLQAKVAAMKRALRP